MKHWSLVSLATAVTLGLLALIWAPQQGGAAAVAGVSQAETVSIAIEPASASLAIGDVASVDVRLDTAAQPVERAEVFIDYDPGVLQVVDAGGTPASSITPGTALGQVSQNRVDAAAGQITYAACCPREVAGGQASGIFTVATVRFKAIGPGSSAIAFSLSPPRGTAVFPPATAGTRPVSILASAANGTITVTPVNDAPSLTGPADGVTISDMAPLLQWANPPGTTQYHLQVRPFNDDGPGINLIRNAVTEGPGGADPNTGCGDQICASSYQVQAPVFGLGNYVMLPGMSYTWRVRTTSAPTAAGTEDPRWGPWSSRTFRTPVLNSSTLSLKAPERTVSGLTPTLQWTNSDPRVFYYEIRVSKDPTFNTDPATGTAMVYWELRHGGVTDPLNSYTVPARFPLERGLVYYWQVRPRVQGDASAVGWSPAAGFVGGAEAAPACLQAATTDANGDVYLPPYAAQFDKDGNVLMPAPSSPDGALGFNGGANQVVDHWVDADQGSVTALYPGMNPSSAGFYTWLNSPENPCGPPTIGGETPAEPMDSDSPDIENEAGLYEALEQAEAELKESYDDEESLKRLPAVNVAPWAPDPNGPCDPLLQGGKPGNCGLTPGALQGRDIIFVNGLLIDAIERTLAGQLLPVWPDQPDGVLTPSGYWKESADKYWDNHVKRFLTDRGRKNRYVTIAYPMTQRLVAGRHAMLTQIAMAMKDGHAVVNPDPNDPRGTGGFCYAGCVVISHSTGALLTDVTMGTAADPALAGQFGAVQYIPNFIKLHVSLGGAISGSQLATAFVAVAAIPGAVPPTFCAVVNVFLSRPAVTPCTPSSILAQSVLIDLMPAVARLKWAPVIGQPPPNLGGRTPMSTLTVASGNHENYWLLKRWLALGLDDGVVTMDSACGKKTIGTWPTGFIPFITNSPRFFIPHSSISPLVFDKGIDGLSAISAHSRATRYFREQTFEHLLNPLLTFVPRVAAACTPYLSSWGMVEPVQLMEGSPLDYYPNHYPFVQTAETHGAGLKDGLEWGFEDTLATSGSSEDIMNNGGLGLVDEAIEGQLHEYVRGPHRTFWKPINVVVVSGLGNCGPGPQGQAHCANLGAARVYYNKEFHTVWLWKRTYHRFQGWETTEAAEYVYKYVLPAP